MARYAALVALTLSGRRGGRASLALGAGNFSFKSLWCGCGIFSGVGSWVYKQE